MLKSKFKSYIKNKYELIPKWLVSLLVVFLAVVVVFSGLMYFYQLNYKYRIYQGVKAGEVDLGGKTKEQAKALIQARIDGLAGDGVEFYYNKKELLLKPIVSVGSYGGEAYEVWSYDAKEMVDGLYDIGRQGSWIKRLGVQLSRLLKKKEEKVAFQLNNDKAKEVLENYFAEFESPGEDAKLVWSDTKVRIAEESTGQVFNYKKAINLLKENLERMDNQRIELKLEVDNPKVTKVKSEFLKKRAGAIANLTPITLSFKKPEYYKGRKRFEYTEWYINQAQLKSWLKIKYSDSPLMNSDSPSVYLGVNEEIVGEFLRGIAEGIDTPAKDAKFEIKNGRVIEWQSSDDGFVLNIKKTMERIERELIKENSNKIFLVVLAQKSKISNEKVNDLGIRELIGEGESNFSGSPRNRKHNIGVGAETLNGLLIKADQEFSLLDALGEINAQTGYKPELVIKEGETIPEYGGGLCQIGTTMFRLVINSGLPITERRNHSYRVGYYEPAGTDATIYNPWPDFKFINDIGGYLLLQTRIEDDDLIFEFWGTTDNRVVTTTKPVIYNIVRPAKPEYIETDKLAPGKKRRLEYAHNGADTHFKRIISWPKEIGREEIEEVWSSHYVPWREKWLVGVEELATSTDSAIE